MGEEKLKEYIKATIHTTTQGAEALAAILPALEITGFSVEDPADLDFILASKESLAWDYVGIRPSQEEGIAEYGEALVSFWIEKGSDGVENKIHELRIALLKLKSDEQYGVYGDDADFGRLWLDTEICYDDWKDKYKEDFRAFSPCEGIVVAPPWDNTGYAGGTLRIVIDPGMAFGTGSHETTAMCLSKLKELLKPGDSLLDAGTGSGILAIAAALLGAADVHAVEIDADAAASAACNIIKNNVSEKISLIEGDITAEGVLPPGADYDLITANLSCIIIEKLLPILRLVLKEEGTMILSGLLDVQEKRMLEALNKTGMRVAGTEKKGEWLMMEVRR